MRTGGLGFPVGGPLRPPHWVSASSHLLILYRSAHERWRHRMGKAPTGGPGTVPIAGQSPSSTWRGTTTYDTRARGYVRSVAENRSKGPAHPDQHPSAASAATAVGLPS